MRVPFQRLSLVFLFIITLSGCQRKDIYDTEIETGTYTAKLIYQQGALSWIPGDFEVIVDEINLSMTGYVEGFNESLGFSTLTSEMWIENTNAYKAQNDAYCKEDTLEKLIKAENVLEASGSYEIDNITYIDYFYLFILNKEIYMLNRKYDSYLNSINENFIPKVLRIWRLVKE